jgi:hypothetical protein
VLRLMIPYNTLAYTAYLRKPLNNVATPTEIEFEKMSLTSRALLHVNVNKYAQSYLDANLLSAAQYDDLYTDASYWTMNDSLQSHCNAFQYQQVNAFINVQRVLYALSCDRFDASGNNMFLATVYGAAQTWADSASDYVARKLSKEPHRSALDVVDAEYVASTGTTPLSETLRSYTAILERDVVQDASTSYQNKMRLLMITVYLVTHQRESIRTYLSVEPKARPDVATVSFKQTIPIMVRILNGFLQALLVFQQAPDRLPMLLSSVAAAWFGEPDSIAAPASSSYWPRLSFISHKPWANDQDTKHSPFLAKVLLVVCRSIQQAMPSTMSPPNESSLLVQFLVSPKIKKTNTAAATTTTTTTRAQGPTPMMLDVNNNYELPETWASTFVRDVADVFGDSNVRIQVDRLISNLNQHDDSSYYEWSGVTIGSSNNEVVYAVLFATNGVNPADVANTKLHIALYPITVSAANVDGSTIMTQTIQFPTAGNTSADMIGDIEKRVKAAFSAHAVAVDDSPELAPIWLQPIDLKGGNITFETAVYVSYASFIRTAMNQPIDAGVVWRLYRGMVTKSNAWKQFFVGNKCESFSKQWALSHVIGSWFVDIDEKGDAIAPTFASAIFRLRQPHHNTVSNIVAEYIKTQRILETMPAVTAQIAAVAERLLMVDNVFDIPAFGTFRNNWHYRVVIPFIQHMPNIFSEHNRVANSNNNNNNTDVTGNAVFTVVLVGVFVYLGIYMFDEYHNNKANDIASILATLPEITSADKTAVLTLKQWAIALAELVSTFVFLLFDGVRKTTVFELLARSAVGVECVAEMALFKDKFKAGPLALKRRADVRDDIDNASVAGSLLSSVDTVIRDTTDGVGIKIVSGAPISIPTNKITGKRPRGDENDTDTTTIVSTITPSAVAAATTTTTTTVTDTNTTATQPKKPKKVKTVTSESTGGDKSSATESTADETKKKKVKKATSSIIDLTVTATESTTDETKKKKVKKATSSITDLTTTPTTSTITTSTTITTTDHSDNKTRVELPTAFELAHTALTMTSTPSTTTKLKKNKPKSKPLEVTPEMASVVSGLFKKSSVTSTTTTTPPPTTIASDPAPVVVTAETTPVVATNIFTTTQPIQENQLNASFIVQQIKQLKSNPAPATQPVPIIQAATVTQPAPVTQSVPAPVAQPTPEAPAPTNSPTSSVFNGFGIAFRFFSKS